MSDFVCLHDSGLAGLVRKGPNLEVKVIGPTMSVSTGISFVKSKNKLECLFIACHGYESYEYNESSNTAMRGGFGLAIGNDNITSSNVSNWAIINGVCKNIVVYSCAAADVAPGQAGKLGDGKYLMGALALHTGSTVYAAEQTQYYNLTRKAYIDFGKWEGPLYCFKSDGAPPKTVSQAPYNMIDLRSTSDKITDFIFG